ncbi:hypothetical protein HNQ56_001364 [Anaerotaenia torta]|uniref:DUF6106 family protein n=1 Tax=Anaerotaenia torta TaxID=433293 RepID=UPI003D225B7A
MNQLYAEAGVKRKNTGKSMGLRALLVLGIIIGVLLLLLGGFFGIGGMVLIVVMIFLFPKLNVEYEYVFVDGQLDFDRITGGARRKTLLRVDMEQMEIVAPQGSHSLDSYNQMQLTNKDFTSGDKSIKPYIIIASVEDKKYRIAFEPSEKMLAMMKQKSPRKVAQY